MSRTCNGLLVAYRTLLTRYYQRPSTAKLQQISSSAANDDLLQLLDETQRLPGNRYIHSLNAWSAPSTPSYSAAEGIISVQPPECTRFVDATTTCCVSSLTPFPAPHPSLTPQSSCHTPTTADGTPRHHSQPHSNALHHPTHHWGPHMSSGAPSSCNHQLYCSTTGNSVPLPGPGPTIFSGLSIASQSVRSQSVGRHYHRRYSSTGHMVGMPARGMSGAALMREEDQAEVQQEGGRGDGRTTTRATLKKHNRELKPHDGKDYLMACAHNTISWSNQSVVECIQVTSKDIPLMRMRDMCLIVWATGRLCSLRSDLQSRPEVHNLLVKVEGALTQLLLSPYHKTLQRPPWTSIDVSTILYGYAKLGSRPNPLIFQNLMETTCNCIHTFGSREISSLIYSLSRLDVNLSPETTSLLMKQVKQVIPGMTAEGIAVTIWGLARLRCTVPLHIVESILHAAQQQVNNFAPNSLEKLFVGLGKLRARVPNQFAHDILVAAAPKVYNFSQKEVQNILMSLTYLNCRIPQVFMDSVLATFNKHPAASQPNDACMFVWACAVVRHRLPFDLLSSVTAAVHPNISHCTHHGLCSFLWGVASMNIYHPPPGFLHDVQLALLSMLPQLQPLNLCQLAWSLAVLKADVLPELFSGLIAEVQRKLSLFSPARLGMLLWGLGQLQHNLPEEFLEVVADTVQSKLPVCGSHFFRAILRGLEGRSPELATEFLDSVLAAVAGKLGEYKPKNYVNLLQALVHCRHPLPRDFLVVMTAAASQKLSEFSEDEFIDFLGLLSQLDPPAAAVMEAERQALKLGKPVFD